MTPQELEALLDLGGRYDLIGDFRRADRVRRRILGKLAPSLLGLWRAAAAWDMDEEAVDRGLPSEIEICAALARLREVKA